MSMDETINTEDDFGLNDWIDVEGDVANVVSVVLTIPPLEERTEETGWYRVGLPKSLLTDIASVPRDPATIKAEIIALQAILSAMDGDDKSIITNEPSTKPAPSHWARTLRQPAHQVIGLWVR